MIKNKDIWVKLEEMQFSYQEICKIKEEIKSLKDLENRLREVMMGTHLVTLINDIRANIAKLNQMTKELKGVVAMSRAALDEGRKFTELYELPELLKIFSYEMSCFSIKNDHLDKIVEKLNCFGFTPEQCDKIMMHLGLDKPIDKS